MHRFRNILVPIDGDPDSQPVLARAGRLARKNGAAIKLIDVVEDLPWYTRLDPSSGWTERNKGRHVFTLPAIYERVRLGRRRWHSVGRGPSSSPRAVGRSFVGRPRPSIIARRRGAAYLGPVCGKRRS